MNRTIEVSQNELSEIRLEYYIVLHVSYSGNDAMSYTFNATDNSLP